MIQEAASLWSGIKRYEEILGKDPQALSFAPLAELYRKAGLLEDALAVARRGTALYPAFAAGQMALARIYLDMMKKSEGTSALESVVRITPENTEAQRMLANLYIDAGNIAAAERCLAIVHQLEPEVVDSSSVVTPITEQASPVTPAAAKTAELSSQSSALTTSGEEFDEEEILDADILELTDEHFEDELSVTTSDSPFAAAPDRPSLQSPVTAPQTWAEPSVEVSPPVPVATATIAELYISQGLKDKGLEVYRELLLADPGNMSYRNRIDELTLSSDIATVGSAECGQAESKPLVSSPDSGLSPKGILETLEGWLSNIRRVKECRSEQP